MAIYAQLADGRKLQFPDGTDKSVIQSTVKKMVGGAAPEPAPAPKPDFSISEAVSPTSSPFSPAHYAAMGLHEVGKSMDWLEKEAKKGGGKLAEALSYHGASPYVSAAVGALVPTGEKAAELLAPVRGAGVKSVEEAGKLGKGFTKALWEKTGIPKAWDILHGVPAKTAAEATRSETMRLAEHQIASEAAKQASLPDSYQTLSGQVKSIADRDVPTDLVKDVKSRVQEYDSVYTDWRNRLKDEWQQSTRRAAASGQTFQSQPATQQFVRKLDEMSEKYKFMPAVKKQLQSFRQMVLGKEGAAPSFDAVETAQQVIKGAASDPATAKVPNLVTDFGELSDSLNNAMSQYAPKYGEMLKKWPDVKNRQAALASLEKTAEQYGKKLEEISPTSAEDPKITLSKSRNILIDMKNDGLISEQQKAEYIAQIDRAVHLYGQTARAQKVASYIALGAAVATMGSAGWWSAKIGHAILGH